MYQIVNDDLAPYLAATAEAVGREMRPPYTIDDLATAFTAIFEGLTLRREADPARVPPERFGELLVPTILLLTRVKGDEETGPDWIAREGPAWAGDG